MALIEFKFSAKMKRVQDMKSLKIIFVVLLVLFGISNVFAQKCEPEVNLEFKVNGDLVGYASYKLIHPKSYLNGEKGTCKCRVGFRTREEKIYSTPGRYHARDFQEFNSPATINGISWRFSDGSFPQTFKWLDDYVKVNGSCLKEEADFLTMKNIRFQEMEQYRIEKEAKNREADDRASKELAGRKIEMDKFCKGMPKINQEIIENISTVGRIDPQSVRLNRVNATDEGYCVATFYTSIGIATTVVGFNVNGIIVSNQSIEFRR